MGRNAEPEPNDAGLLVMLLLVVLGTLIMAWVADQKAPAEPAALTTEAPARLR